MPARLTRDLRREIRWESFLRERDRNPLSITINADKELSQEDRDAIKVALIELKLFEYQENPLNSPYYFYAKRLDFALRNREYTSEGQRRFTLEEPKLDESDSEDGSLVFDKRDLHNPIDSEKSELDVEDIARLMNSIAFIKRK